jgi:hypothetical protein
MLSSIMSEINKNVNYKNVGSLVLILPKINTGPVLLANKMEKMLSFRTCIKGCLLSKRSLKLVFLAFTVPIEAVLCP